MRTYSFCYSLEGILTELPTYLIVKARTLRKATKAARRKLKVIEREARVMYDCFTRGHLYLPGVEERPRKPLTPEQIARQKAVYDQVIAPMIERAGGFAVLQAVIDMAPPMADLFKQPSSSSSILLDATF